MDPELRNEIRSLTTRFGAVVREQAGEAVYAKIEELRSLSKDLRRDRGGEASGALSRATASLSVEDAHQVAHAFSLFFQLANLCEERARIRHLQATPHAAQSSAWLFRELKKADVPPARVQACLDLQLAQLLA